MVVCVLANPSNDLTEKLYQLDTLYKLNGDSYVSEDSIPYDLKPKSYIFATEEITKKFLSGEKKMPNNFGIKVKLTTTCCIPNNIHPRALKEAKINTKPDAIAQAYIDKYELTDINTVVIVWDHQFNNVNQYYLSSAVNKLKNIDQSKIKIVVFVKGDKECPISGNNLFKVHGLSTDLLLSTVTVCKNHILTGNSVGLICAYLASQTQELNCIYPKPWSLEKDIELPLNWIGLTYFWPNTKYFDRIYYINLERRTDRRLNMEKQLQKFNLCAARVQAVDGKNTIKWRPEFGVWSPTWNEGAFGYCLSYRQALIDAIKNGYENVLIMDDDAVLSDNLFEVLEKAWNDLPDNWHMLYLAANHGQENSPTRPGQNDKVGENLYRLKGSLGSHAIIINRVAFETILNFLMSPYGPLDVFFSLYQQIFVHCYVTNPGLAIQLPGYSDIINKDVDYSSKIDYINHESGSKK